MSVVNMGRTWHAPLVKADGGMLFSYQNLGHERYRDFNQAEVPPVSLLENLELLAKETSKGGTNNRT